MATRAAKQADRILDAALELAELRGWEAVRLHEVARSAGCTLDDIRQHYREKEDLVDAWFDRADGAMLRAAEAPDFDDLSSRQRIHRLMMTWFEALAPRQRVTRQMIANKLEPGHVHIQFAGLLRVSRTVQWIREAAHRDATFLFRALEESALTSIYLATFAYWLQDRSEGFDRTRRLLDTLLGTVERADAAIKSPANRGTGSDSEHAPADAG